ncbi:MAG: hypothetical protein Q9169_003678 [Polycauliona sp. 2 TL-2023]
MVGFGSKALCRPISIIYDLLPPADVLEPYVKPPSPCALTEKSNMALSKFLCLPAEIRFNIYSLCLVISTPTVVWSAQEEYHWDRTGIRTWDYESMASGIPDLALGLLRCSRAIAMDAAHTFYRGNTFYFVGNHEYYPIITWLDRIGQRNRDSLASLDIEIFPPRRAFQLPDGTRIGRTNSRYQRSSPRHPHFVSPEIPCPEGEVDVINPAMETIISFFARCGSDTKLKLVFDIGFETAPGIDCGFHPMTMDLPNLIEKWRNDYTHGRITILWRGEAESSWLTENRALMEQQGWKILPGDNIERPWLTWSRVWCPETRNPPPLVHFVLKRKKLTGPLMAADPISGHWRQRSFAQ